MVAAWGALEWTFAILVGSFVVVAGLFGLYLALLPFRNTGLRRRSERTR